MNDQINEVQVETRQVERLQMMPIDQARDWYSDFVAFSKSIMKPDLDYGIIPGTPKPSQGLIFGHNPDLTFVCCSPSSGNLLSGMKVRFGAYCLLAFARLVVRDGMLSRKGLLGVLALAVLSQPAWALNGDTSGTNGPPLTNPPVLAAPANAPLTRVCPVCRLAETSARR